MGRSPRRDQLDARLAELTARPDANTPRLENVLRDTRAALERLHKAPLAERIGVPVHTTRSLEPGRIITMGKPAITSVVMHPLTKVQLEHPRDPSGQVAAAVDWLLSEAASQFKLAEFRHDDRLAEAYAAGNERGGW